MHSPVQNTQLSSLDGKHGEINQAQLPQRREVLSEEAIISAAEQYFKKNGKFPSSGSRELIPSMPGECWRNIDGCGSQGIRGLEKGRTLSRILRPLREAHGALLSEAAIVEGIKKYYEFTGEWPTATSTDLVPGMKGVSWRMVDGCGAGGYRGLKKGLSVAKLVRPLKEAQGVILRKNDLTEALIISAAEKYFALTGRWPVSNSKDLVPGIPGENWRSINNSAIDGNRGLEKGRYLSCILKDVKRAHGVTVKDPLTKSLIRAAIKDFHEISGRWPHCETKDPVPGIVGETWSAIDQAARHGYRGLERGGSLSKIVSSLKRKYDLSLSSLPLPPAFKRARESVVLKKLESRVIGASVTQERNISFSKGEVFEQLAGVLLLTLHPDQLVIPQYCLDVDKASGFFGKRADFKAGNAIYEIKWGNFTSDIVRSAEAHSRALGAGQSYRLVLLNENPDLGISYSLFSELVGQSKLAETVKGIQEQMLLTLEGVDVGGMIQLRNYLHGVLLKGGSLFGVRRLSFLEKELGNFLRCEEKEAYIAEHTYAWYSPLCAYFEVDGKLYNSRIAPKALQQEHPEQYRTLYHFGALTFTDSLVRDVAVMCELASWDGEGVRVEEMLGQNSGIIGKADFSLPNGAVISSDDISRLEDLKLMLRYDEGCFEFGLEYLAFCGHEG